MQQSQLTFCPKKCEEKMRAWLYVDKQVHHTKCPLHSIIDENSLDLLSNRLYGSTY